MISEQIGLDLLRTYVAVCRQGSLSRVAEQTGRTQSALSMQMRRLESLLERHLFQRTGRGVVPTPEGEIFLGYATRMLALGDEAWARLRAAEVSGTVRIGLAEEIANTALPAALGRLHRAFPDIQLDVVVEHSTSLGRMWDENEMDIMIAPTASASVDAMVTWNVELQWASAADYVPDETQPLALVVFAAPCQWRRRAMEALTAIGREYRVTFSSQSVMGMQAAIENSLGIGLLPPELVRSGTMRTLTTTDGVPDPLVVQYGLYALDRRPRVVDATIDVLLEATSPCGARS
ncbi:LysR family transcriptional regulator [Steroidobacter sp. S1-65]|uniref:LysR family transcriptional regulator n=1 Tax=Steroidobacter gossypii TaxID=2805490 RepID=A0ABS1X6J5_9GAMM|nr:LysR substrate-binding domain-containing protein [Steroidobacter gossypii]MBM0108845.1 LysR family transcriptional regulator [Steroidobacter gossypii]